MNIYIAGSKGMVGTAVTRLLSNQNEVSLVYDNGIDLRDQNAVRSFFAKNEIDTVVVAAARVGGIIANSKYPYDFIYDNIMIEANIINAALAMGIEKLIFLGSSCIYPKLAPQPLKEEYLLTGELELTNEWYAIAKIAGIKLCQAANKQHGSKYISLMPTNLYGERDNFDLESSHVMPAMIRKFHEALPDKDVVLWGSGSPMREFMHVKDLANAIMYLLEHDVKDNLYNVGTGEDLSIKELAYMIQRITGHTGAIIWNTDKPDGTPRKLLDVGKLHDMGWRHQIDLEEGIKETYKWFLNNIDSLREVKHEKK